MYGAFPRPPIEATSLHLAPLSAKFRPLPGDWIFVSISGCTMQGCINAKIKECGMTDLSFVPEDHRVFLENALKTLGKDDRIVGVAIGGSFLTRSMDTYSDLDLVLAVEPSAFEEVLRERKGLAHGLGNLVAAFTGEHVGEPRLLICLYDTPVLHVDLKFVSLADARERVEDPVILLDRDNRLGDAMQVGEPCYPAPSLQWIEDRFWVWVHYGATKIARGELFEALDFLSFLRLSVLGPLALMEAGARPSGVRKLESLAPERARKMLETVATHDPDSCYRGMKEAISLYLSLRGSLRDEGLLINEQAQRVAREFLDRITSNDPAEI